MATINHSELGQVIVTTIAEYNDLKSKGFIYLWGAEGKFCFRKPSVFELRQFHLPIGTKLTLKHDVNDDAFYSNMKIVQHHKNGIEIEITNNLFKTPLNLTLSDCSFEKIGNEITFKVDDTEKRVTYVILD